MAKMNKAAAEALAEKMGVQLHRDFHSLSWEDVQKIHGAAKEYGYRKGKAACGSLARGFYQYMCRAL